MENTNDPKLAGQKSGFNRNNNPETPSGLAATRNTGKHSTGTAYLRKVKNRAEAGMNTGNIGAVNTGNKVV